MSIETIAIKDIRTDGGTQPRVQLDKKTVEEYADAMRNGSQFPAVTVFLDDQDVYWLADGFHRLEAAKLLKLDRIGAEVQRGSVRDAILYSFGANASHGLRRTKADLWQAIKRILTDEEWGQWSDREIARLVNTSHQTVGRVRKELPLSGPVGPDAERRVIRDGKEFTMNTAGINAGRESESPALTSQPADDYTWLERWQEFKKRSPETVVFATTGENHETWIAMEGDAARVARILGVPMSKFSAPGDPFPIREAVRLHVPEPKPAWVEGLYAALEGRLHWYPEWDPELMQIAEQQIPTADPENLQPAAPTEPASQPGDAEGFNCPDCSIPMKFLYKAHREVPETDTEPKHWSSYTRYVCPGCGQSVDSPEEHQEFSTGATVQTSFDVPGNTPEERDLARARALYASTNQEFNGDPSDSEEPDPSPEDCGAFFLASIEPTLIDLIRLGEKAIAGEPEEESRGVYEALVDGLKKCADLMSNDLETIHQRPERAARLRKQIAAARTRAELEKTCNLSELYKLRIVSGNHKVANTIVAQLRDEIEARRAEFSRAEAEASPSAAR